MKAERKASKCRLEYTGEKTEEGGERKRETETDRQRERYKKKQGTGGNG